MRLVCPCLLFVFSVMVVILITVVCSVTLETDIQALHLLRRSIDPNTIPTSSFLNSWDSSFDPCESIGTWFLGILCTEQDNNGNSRVTTIELDNVGYDGFLAPAIGNLTELTTLNIGQNNFRGPIPNTISNLQKLTRLSISGNFFTGNIPIGLPRLRKLEILDLSHNNLSGSIPSKLSALRNLVQLSLSHNEFSGKIPDITGSWQLHTLELDSNQFYGTLPNFPINLRTLSLSYNVLSGNISSLGKLQHLKSLDLSCNRFSGSISQQVVSLPYLVQLNVSINRFNTIAVPRFDGRPTQLQDFDAHGNQLHGGLPINLVTISNLTIINLSRNLFHGSLPRVYGERLGNPWKRLYLDHNFLSGDIPQEFNSGLAGMHGSLANNCLKCPKNFRLCRGGQRASSECVHAGQDKDSD